MKHTVFAAATLALVCVHGAAHAAAASGAPSDGSTSTAGDVSAGQSKSAVCAGCHGPDGNSPSGNFPKIAGQHEKYLFKQLQDYKSGARKNALMAGQVANLSEQDMRDLAAYYAAQDASAGKADPELVDLGSRIYRGGNPATGVPACSACHGPAGMGNPMANFPRLSGQHAQYTRGQLEGFQAAARAGRQTTAEDMPGRANDAGRMMQSIAKNMSADEIEAVSSFIEGLHMKSSSR